MIPSVVVHVEFGENSEKLLREASSCAERLIATLTAALAALAGSMPGLNATTELASRDTSVGQAAPAQMLMEGAPAPLEPSTAGMARIPPKANGRVNPTRVAAGPAAPSEPRTKPVVGLPAWRAQRDAIVRRDWPADVPVGAIAKSIAALGGEVMTNHRIGVRAAYLGLKRPVRSAVATAAPIASKPPTAAAASAPARPSLKDFLGNGELSWAAAVRLADYLGCGFDGDMAPINKALGARGVRAAVLVEPYPDRPGDAASARTA